MSNGEKSEPKCRFDPKSDLSHGSIIVCKWCLRPAEQVLADKDKRECWPAAQEAVGHYPDRLYRGSETRAS